MSYPKLNCQWCGKQFVSDRAATKYCSQKCRDIAHRIKLADPHEDPFLLSVEPIKPKKSYEEYLAEDRMRPPSKYLAPPGAHPPQRITGHRNNY